MDALHVHDLVARVARPEDAAAPFDGVEHRADAAIARGVRERLEPAPLQLDEEGGELAGRPERVACGVGPVGVGRQHRGGVRLDHVVDVELDRRDAQAIVPEPAHRLLELVEPGARRAGQAQQRGDQPRAERALAAGSFEQREVVQAVLWLDDGGDAQRGGHVERGDQPLVLGVAAVAGNHPFQGALALLADPQHGEVVDVTGGLAGGVRLGGAPREANAVARDAQTRHGLAVQPGGVHVVAEQECGEAARGALQHVGGRRAAGDRRVVPALALDPGGIRVRVEICRNPLVDLPQRGGAGQLHGPGVGAQAHVVVGVHEAGQHGRAGGVDHLGGRAHERLGVGVGSDPRDPGSPDGDRLGARHSVVHRVDARVPHDQIGGDPCLGGRRAVWLAAHAPGSWFRSDSAAISR